MQNLNKLMSILVLVVFMGSVAQRSPIRCAGKPHFPTIEDAPISQHFKHLGHVGIDYRVKVGTEVYAVMSGVVILMTQDSPVYGRFIMILHSCDQYASLYAHLSETKVKWGDRVQAGQLIGYSGGDPYDNIDGDGQTTGWHLHFEIRHPDHLTNNLYNLDPDKYLEIAGEYREPPCIVRRVR